VFFDLVSKLIVVPAFTQNNWFDFPSAVVGAMLAPDPLFRIDTTHGVEADPQVFAAVHRFSVCGWLQA